MNPIVHRGLRAMRMGRRRLVTRDKGTAWWDVDNGKDVLVWARGRWEISAPSS